MTLLQRMMLWRFKIFPLLLHRLRRDPQSTISLQHLAYFSCSASILYNGVSWIPLNPCLLPHVHIASSSTQESMIQDSGSGGLVSAFPGLGGAERGGSCVVLLLRWFGRYRLKYLVGPQPSYYSGYELLVCYHQLSSNNCYLSGQQQAERRIECSCEVDTRLAPFSCHRTGALRRVKCIVRILKSVQ